MRLPDFRLETFFSRWEFVVKHNLAASDMESRSVEELLTLADETTRRGWDTLRLGYVPTEGTPALREAIAGWYDSIDADQVLCLAGAQEGIFCAMHALLDSGDHAIVLVPNYQSMESVPESLCQVTGVALREADRWRLDLDDVRKAFRPNTRLVAVNFPNNPTGAVPDRDTFLALAALCADRGVYLFSDEAYRGIERDASRRLPHAADIYEKGLSLGVASKSLGLAGLRVGWLACKDKAVLSKMERVKHYTSICNSAPSEFLATIAILARADILADNAALAARNRELLFTFFGRYRQLFEWYQPDGGSVLFPRYTGPGGAEDFCRELVEQAGVLLLPPSVFQSSLLPTPTDRFRIGYGRRDFAAGLKVFAEFLDSRG